MALRRELTDRIPDISRECFSWGIDAQRVGGGVIEVWVTADGVEVARWQEPEPAGVLSDYLIAIQDELIPTVRASGRDAPPRLQRRPVRLAKPVR